MEFDGTLGWPVGEPGQGVKTILEMVTMTRLDCVIGSAAGQRAALVQAVHHARHRRVFGALLIDQPVMRAVLADLQLEVEAATLEVEQATQPRSDVPDHHADQDRQPGREAAEHDRHQHH